MFQYASTFIFMDILWQCTYCFVTWYLAIVIIYFSRAYTHLYGMKKGELLLLSLLPAHVYASEEVDFEIEFMVLCLLDLSWVYVRGEFSHIYLSMGIYLYQYILKFWWEKKKVHFISRHKINPLSYTCMSELPLTLAASGIISHACISFRNY